MTAALRLCRLALGLVAALFMVQVTVASAEQSGHDVKPSVAPAKPSITPPRMSQQDVTKPAAGHGHEATPVPAKTAEHSKPAGHAKPAGNATTAEPGAEAAPAQHENAKEAGTPGTRHVVTPGPSRRMSAERAVAALGAALSARRERVARQEAAAPPPEQASPARRAAPRRRVVAAAPAPPPPPRYEVPWPDRIVELRWTTPSEHRAVSWPSERPEPIQLRWDLKALQSDLSEETAAVSR